MMLSCIAALTPDLVIGQNNCLPWHLPADLRYFKATTLGKPVVMGRNTWDSIGRPLPGRRNIVLSRDPGFAPAGCEVFRDVQQVIDLTGTSTSSVTGEALPEPVEAVPRACRGGSASEIMVIGGATVYRLLLPHCQRLYLTWVEANIQGDAWFPAPDWAQWREIRREAHPADASNPYPYAFTVWERA